jgi:fatty-acid peroxygenase
MPEIPRDRAPDSSLGLLRDGYEFVGRRARRHQADVFEARLLLQTTICMLGRDAAVVFYDEGRFQRSQAAPSLLKKTLVGEGGVQGMDDSAHRHRKQLFMGLMTPNNIERLGQLVADEWDRAIPRMENSDHVVLFDEARVNRQS